MAQVCLITGASRGIGAAVAKQMAQQGYAVALHYNANGAKAEAVAASLPAVSASAHKTFKADLSSAAACEALIAEVIKAMGGLDVLVNNAGVSYDSDDWLAESYEAWQKAWNDTIAVNLVAPCILSTHAVKHFMAANADKACKGRIVSVSSRGAIAGDPTAPAYAASKSGLNVWHTSVAQNVAKDGIFVYTVSPGATRTEMWTDIASPEAIARIEAGIPLRRMTEPDEIAKAIAWFATEAPAAMTGCVADANGASYPRP